MVGQSVITRIPGGTADRRDGAPHRKSSRPQRAQAGTPGGSGCRVDRRASSSWSTTGDFWLWMAVPKPARPTPIGLSVEVRRFWQGRPSAGWTTAVGW
jgi:hypothetical protein